MKYIKETLDFHISDPCVLTLGKFDGLHSGHRYLMEAMEEGKSMGLKSVVFTFDIPPKSIHEKQYTVLSTNEEKEKIFADAGVDYLIECPFTEELRRMSPCEFLEMLTSKIHVKMVVVGTDFCFGFQRSGNYKVLREYENTFGYRTIVVKKKQYLGEDISSTRIRNCIIAGDMETANLLLGYAYFVSGQVVKGNQIGRTVGIPTANQILPPEKLLPPKGVYASKILLRGREYIGISNVGQKPTIEGSFPMGIETNIFDFEGDIYGENIKVSLYRFIRPERKFDSLQALVAQMNLDILTSKSFFAE